MTEHARAGRARDRSSASPPGIITAQSQHQQYYTTVLKVSNLGYLCRLRWHIDTCSPICAFACPMVNMYTQVFNPCSTTPSSSVPVYQTARLIVPPKQRLVAHNPVS